MQVAGLTLITPLVFFVSRTHLFVCWPPRRGTKPGPYSWVWIRTKTVWSREQNAVRPSSPGSVSLKTLSPVTWGKDTILYWFCMILCLALTTEVKGLWHHPYSLNFHWQQRHLLCFCKLLMLDSKLICLFFMFSDFSNNFVFQFWLSQQSHIFPWSFSFYGLYSICFRSSLSSLKNELKNN